MKVPFWGAGNYSSVMGSPYKGEDGWIFIDDVLKIMSEEFISTYSAVDSRNLVAFFKQNDYSAKTITLGGSQQSLQSVLTGLKLLMPTLWNANYFTWDVGKGGHHGVDIIMPQGTPLPAFLDGNVARVKTWDGAAKNEGNCVVLKSNFNGEDIYICYEHLDKINVSLGDNVLKGQIIGFCGTTGNSTQYHLHLQVDKSSAQFHPYRSADMANLQKFTYDPIKILRKIFGVESVVVQPSLNQSQPTQPVVHANAQPSNPNPSGISTAGVQKNKPDTTGTSKVVNDDLISEVINKLNTSNGAFVDMPNNQLYASCINDLYNKGIIKGNNGRIFPDASIKRYEFALLINRLIGILNLNLPVLNANSVQYTDVNYSDVELSQALDKLYKTGMMKGSNGNFYPNNNLKGEEVLAVLGRMVYQLQDSANNLWYLNYLNKFVSEGIIKSNWLFIGKDIDRKETFMIIDSILQKSGKI